MTPEEKLENARKEYSLLHASFTSYAHSIEMELGHAGVNLAGGHNGVHVLGKLYKQAVIDRNAAVERYDGAVKDRDERKKSHARATELALQRGREIEGLRSQLRQAEENFCKSYNVKIRTLKQWLDDNPDKISHAAWVQILEIIE